LKSLTEGDSDRPVEDLIADRMGQYVSTDTRVPEMLDQAIKLGLAYLKEQAG
jgi:hypothetical protein